MRPTHPRSFRAQANLLRRQFLQDDGLPFADVLTEGIIAEALAAVGGWLDRIFSPLVTLWVFLGQVLSPDHSCRAAVARLIAHRVARGQRPCSARTGAYCRARQRLPEGFFSAVACSVGRALDARADRRWLWKGRRVYLFDGTTVTMPDTPENQAAYPQVYNQGPGLGFPIARIGAVISLACGAVVNLGFCRYAGKGQGEVSLLRRLWDVLAPGDVILADRLTANWATIHLLQQRGVGLVSRLNKAHRRADFRRGRRLGREDHVVRWAKPTSIRSLDREAYRALPESITVREVRVRVAQPGFRTKSVVVVTTLLDPRQTTKEDLADAVPGAVERGTRPAVDQVGDADARVAGEDAGDGPQGGVGAHPGLQPDPHRDGPGRGAARRRAAVDQLHGSPADPGGLSAAAHARDGRRHRGPLAPVPRPARRHRRPPGRGPPRPVRAAGEEAEAESLRLADPATGRDQTPDGETPYPEVSAIRVSDRMPRN